MELVSLGISFALKNQWYWKGGWPQTPTLKATWLPLATTLPRGWTVMVGAPEIWITFPRPAVGPEAAQICGSFPLLKASCLWSEAPVPSDPHGNGDWSL